MKKFAVMLAVMGMAASMGGMTAYAENLDKDYIVSEIWADARNGKSDDGTTFPESSYKYHLLSEWVEDNYGDDDYNGSDIGELTYDYKDYYGVTSFIIVSSDSDFWGLISSLPNAKFIVMYEYEKCGTAIKNALSEHGIYYCAIDDFCTAGTDELKKTILFDELEKHLPTLIGENPLQLTQRLYENTRITATQKEMEVFCNKYVRTLRLKISEGECVIEIQK